MSDKLSRRTLLGAAPVFAILKPELVRGAGTAKLKAGLVGCGGRGTAAVDNLLTGNESVEVVAMADLFEDHLEGSLRKLTQDASHARIASRVKVGPDRRYTGFDAYRKLAESDLDIVMLCTPPGYRPAHFEAAVNANKHIFFEKPIATDPVGTRRFMAAAAKSAERKLSVVSGAQRHSDREYMETVAKVKDGAVGEVLALYSRFLSGPVWHENERKAEWSDMEYECRNWYSYLWLCGDQMVEQHFHNIDFMNWVMGTHPQKVVASGGAAWRPREAMYGNIYDHMSSDFVYPNGVHLSSECRQYPAGLYRAVDDLVVGSKGRTDGKSLGSKGVDPYVQEHIDLVKSITGQGPYLNQAMAVAESTMTCIMARESAYSGLEITWDMIMASKQDLQPARLSLDEKREPVPLPAPGRYKFV
jgi:myo-inositol 2-dehydrogenase / D-chiro-inositol 1-dehydrogenase